MMKRILKSFLLGMLAVGNLLAQNVTNVPTSMYGIGELAPADGGKYAGLGSAAIALNRQGFMNTQNPACLTSMDTTRFVYDIGMTGSYSRYSMLGERSEAFEGNLTRISLGIRMLPRWYTMVGVAPYSTVGYLIQTMEEVEGMGGARVYSIFEGTGGLYKLYMSNAFLINKSLSFGVNMGMISGSVEQTETQESAVVTRKSEKGAFYAELGLHYRLSHRWSVGLVYGFSTKLKQENTLTYDNSSTDSNLDGTFRSDKMYVPQRLGVGLTYASPRWVVTGDCSWMQWGRNRSIESSVKYIDQYRANLGTVFITSPRKPRSTELMMGVGYSNSYLKLKGGKMHYLDASVGVAVPFQNTVVSLGVTWRRQMNTCSQLMQEDRLSLNLNITFGEVMSRWKVQ